MKDVLVSVLAGRGVNLETAACLNRLKADEHIKKIFLLTIEDRNEWPVLKQADHRWNFDWLGEWHSELYVLPMQPMKSHLEMASAKETLRKELFIHTSGDENINWIVMLDDDTCCSPNYFDFLIAENFPIMGTGYTFNPDGTRWVDLGAHITVRKSGRHEPGYATVPKIDVESHNFRSYEKLYVNGAQWIFNRKAILLNVKNEVGFENDVWYSQAMVNAGCRLRFFKDRYITCLHQHAPCGRFPHDPETDSLIYPNL